MPASQDDIRSAVVVITVVILICVGWLGFALNQIWRVVIDIRSRKGPSQ